MRSERVVVVCGETGSGKTTQLPKICLAAGRGVAGRIGHTQPRRIAARSVAERIAEEMGSPLGRDVGYKIRFDDQTSPSVVVKLMTDGILLAESQRDPRLREYDTLILDEAHERSLNIDFLLGYLKRLLVKRRDLHLVITSATIDPDSFSRHFGDAPVIEVSGRTYPVDVRYRPLDAEADEQTAQERGIVAGLEEVFASGPGDALVFLSGEREIRDTAEVVGGHFGEAVEVLPLFGRLAARDQHRIFQRGPRRRVVLATNIAETSLTVPGIRFVVDTGRARISRFHPGTKVQRLPIEAISQASAAQRAGRCGRVAAGICIRLFSEEDFAQREAFTPPEILRTNLASVILQMKVMRLGDIEDFPFLEPPDVRAIREGIRLLHELRALDETGEPTPLGRTLAKFPVDPRIAAILVASQGEGCLEEALVVGAALSLPDPRIRPADKPDRADEAHAPYADPRSDFIAFLRLWGEIHRRREQLTRNQFSRWCQKSFLSHPRVLEWIEVQRQLRRTCRQSAGLAPVRGAQPRTELGDEAYAALHRALLHGLLSNVATRQDDGRAMTGTGSKSIFVFPGSGLFAKPPKWIVAAELVETTRLYARTCAGVEPRWIEQVGAHLVQRSLSEPFWSARSGRVEARERVSLGGLVLHPGRPVDFGRRHPDRARAIFLRSALVEGNWQTQASFAAHNATVLAAVAELEDRVRRRGIFAGEGALEQFYDARLPADVFDARSFERWQRRSADPDALHMTLDDVVRAGREAPDAFDFPDTWSDGDLELELCYRFEPGHPADGVTAQIPIAALPMLRAEVFEWLVPGYLAEKVDALLRSLPKTERRRLLPLADAAAAFLDIREPAVASLLASLHRFVERRLGARLPPAVFDVAKLPPHLVMNFRVFGSDGEVLGEGRDLRALQEDLLTAARQSLRQAVAPSGFARSGVRAWDFGTLPIRQTVRSGGLDLEAYPAVLARPDHVDLALLAEEAEAARRSRLGIARLALLALPEQAKVLAGATTDELALRYRTLPPAPLPTSTDGACGSPADEIALAAATSLLDELPRDEAAFRATVVGLRGRLWPAATRTAQRASDLLRRLATLRERLPSLPLDSREDVEEQLSHLLYRGFLLATPEAWLDRFPHYLRGLELRLVKAKDDPDRDQRRLQEIAPRWRDLLAAAAERGLPDIEHPRWIDYRFGIEELRLQVFAQEVRTRGPVSPKRLAKAWAELELR